jgi:hypothetical protein
MFGAPPAQHISAARANAEGVRPVLRAAFKAVRQGRCKEALGHLLTAERRAGKAESHILAAGEHGRRDATATRAVNRATRDARTAYQAISSRCLR